MDKWPDFIKKWVFVHNDPEGIPAEVVNHLDNIRRDNPNIKIEIWTRPELLKLFHLLSLEAKYSIFGQVPSQQVINNLRYEDLQPVLDALEKQEPDVGAALSPAPSATKLEKNDLSIEAADFLRIGRRKAQLVAKYFQNENLVELGEKIAEGLRVRYAELKALNLDADSTFFRLQQFV